MELISNSRMLLHDTGMHPESRKRLEAFTDLPETDVPLDEGPLRAFHTEAYVNQVKDACLTGGGLDDGTAVSPGSFEAAVLAANATLLAAERGDFALVRPPGHHAHAGHSSGFCLFNNVGIAAQRLAAAGRRVLILDFDGHLGDGTVGHFYDRKDVLYWSLHQYPAFPGGGDFSEIGNGDGKGYTINVPLPPGAADDLFLESMDRLLPIADAFAPDVVALSAGFDSHEHDLLLELRFSTGVFYTLGQRLRGRFPHIFATLEGGYNVLTLPECVSSFLAGINGEANPFSATRTESHIKVHDEFEIVMGGLQAALQPYWSI